MPGVWGQNIGFSSLVLRENFFKLSQHPYKVVLSFGVMNLFRSKIWVLGLPKGGKIL